LLLIFSVELCCFFLLGFPEKNKFNFELPDVEETHVANVFGYVPYADSIVEDKKVINGETIFDVNYTIGSSHERITPKHDSLKSKYALFFGCSIAFGYGLDDDQTLPYQFQNHSDYNSYNYGYSGYGTNHMLARLQYQNLREAIPTHEKNGAAFYIFYWDHIERSIGSMDHYTQWLYNAPYYEMADGHLKRNKTFKNGRPFTSSIYEILYQSSIVNYFDIKFPLSISENHLDLVSEMVLESKNTYTKQFGNDNFYVVIYPTYEEEEPEKLAQFLVYLEKKGIDIINLDEGFDYDWSYAIHANEPHPNAFSNDTTGQRLVQHLKSQL
jgi:hypothetical protein